MDPLHASVVLALAALAAADCSVIVRDQTVPGAMLYNLSTLTTSDITDVRRYGFFSPCTSLSVHLTSPVVPCSVAVGLTGYSDVYCYGSTDTQVIAEAPGSIAGSGVVLSYVGPQSKRATVSLQCNPASGRGYVSGTQTNGATFAVLNVSSAAGCGLPLPAPRLLPEMWVASPLTASLRGVFTESNSSTLLKRLFSPLRVTNNEGTVFVSGPNVVFSLEKGQWDVPATTFLRPNGSATIGDISATNRRFYYVYGSELRALDMGTMSQIASYQLPNSKVRGDAIEDNRFAFVDSATKRITIVDFEGTLPRTTYAAIPAVCTAAPSLFSFSRASGMTTLLCGRTVVSGVLGLLDRYYHSWPLAAALTQVTAVNFYNKTVWVVEKNAGVLRAAPLEQLRVYTADISGDLDTNFNTGAPTTFSYTDTNAGRTYLYDLASLRDVEIDLSHSYQGRTDSVSVRLSCGDGERRSNIVVECNNIWRTPMSVGHFGYISKWWNSSTEAQVTVSSTAGCPTVVPFVEPETFMASVFSSSLSGYAKGSTGKLANVPAPLAVSNNKNTVFVLTPQYVYSLSKSRWTAERFISVRGDTTQEMSASPSRLFLVSSNGTLTVVDLSTRTFVKSLELGATTVRGDAIDNGRFVFVNGRTNDISVVTVADGSVETFATPAECKVAPAVMSFAQGSGSITFVCNDTVVAGIFDALSEIYYTWKLPRWPVTVLSATYKYGTVWVATKELGVLRAEPRVALQQYSLADIVFDVEANWGSTDEPWGKR
eukprot:m51a1_g456 hypothetical protein (767) ;mRNA; f:150169-152695